MGIKWPFWLTVGGLRDCQGNDGGVKIAQVRCIVRPRQNPADFLRDWGATTVQADLGDPTSLPAALVGIHTVIDCATARPEESTQKVDWDGKVALIQCAQVGCLAPLSVTQRFWDVHMPPWCAALLGVQ